MEVLNSVSQCYESYQSANLLLNLHFAGVCCPAWWSEPALLSPAHQLKNKDLISSQGPAECCLGVCGMWWRVVVSFFLHFINIIILFVFKHFSKHKQSNLFYFYFLVLWCAWMSHGDRRAQGHCCVRYLHLIWMLHADVSCHCEQDSTPLADGPKKKNWSYIFTHTKKGWQIFFWLDFSCSC